MREEDSAGARLRTGYGSERGILIEVFEKLQKLADEADHDAHTFKQRGETTLYLASQMQQSAYVDALCILKDAMDSDYERYRRWQRERGTEGKTINERMTNR